MGFFEKLNKAKGGYIFISHSHDDIERVREIRNRLEKDGFEPLCFYLKCLDDDSEIEDLIKREIDAREWFVFVNSENSRKSKWVMLEREYITSTNSKKVITIDIDDEDSVFEAVQRITHNLRVFISYSMKDIELARRVKEKLEKKDYLVFFAPDSIPAGSSYTEVAYNAILEASQEGCVLALLTPQSLKSMWVVKELEFAIAQGGNVVPVLVGDAELGPIMEFILEGKQLYRLPEAPTDKDIDKMIDSIGNYIADK
ncbi:MAG: toll/interleukin-1 receptor domain-containing protein [Clostridia bacterium]|nr:toll/interleukin-1 receptor domain-containing protein [Clostridia bacterium]